MRGKTGDLRYAGDMLRRGDRLPGLEPFRDRLRDQPGEEQLAARRQMAVVEEQEFVAAGGERGTRVERPHPMLSRHRFDGVVDFRLRRPGIRRTDRRPARFVNEQDACTGALCREHRVREHRLQFIPLVTGVVDDGVDDHVRREKMRQVARQISPDVRDRCGVRSAIPDGGRRFSTTTAFGPSYCPSIA